MADRSLHTASASVLPTISASRSKQGFPSNRAAGGQTQSRSTAFRNLLERAFYASKQCDFFATPVKIDVIPSSASSIIYLPVEVAIQYWHLPACATAVTYISCPY
ncbi:MULTISPECIES: hypothetical protein [unclassified Caballeronia]|uniref:hypothetical protein n=1 Tax=unclassified Caballeronia TaxID=2646786 RepID=UPI00286558DB|nr:MULTISPECIES: hypothetical protein [unclassified Caballeronia]MDR5777184.1 hypothetical protein [Caballeronia sp. LZ002]MDR5852591.1 hypothetical protein [Caballeronia sp. LZ003]